MSWKDRAEALRKVDHDAAAAREAERLRQETIKAKLPEQQALSKRIVEKVIVPVFERIVSTLENSAKSPIVEQHPPRTITVIQYIRGHRYAVNVNALAIGEELQVLVFKGNNVNDTMGRVIGLNATDEDVEDWFGDSVMTLVEKS